VAILNNSKTGKLAILLGLLFLPGLLLVLYLLNFRDKSLQILPSDEFLNKGRWAYCNPESVNHYFKSNEEETSIDYTLGGNVAYAGLGFNLAYNFPFLDLSAYDTLQIKVYTGRAQTFFVAIRTYEPGLSDPKKNFEPARHCEVITPTRGLQSVYKIPLSLLKDPQWWIAQNAAQKINLEKQPLKYALVMQVFISDYSLIGQRELLSVRGISFHITPLVPEVLIWCLAAGYYVLFGFFLLWSRRKRQVAAGKQSIISSYKKLALSSYKEQDIEKINQFIKEHYFEPDVTIEKLIQMTGLSQKRISDILHKEYKMNFKEFINWLRLEEAKRLLKETDINIIEIAFRLGYNSNSYFGSIFKKVEGLSPREYRERHTLLH
jgi:AraC-like DNA-binding protein